MILPLLILGCKSTTEKKSQKSSSIKVNTLAHPIKKTTIDTVEVDPSKIECIPTAYSYGYQDNFSPGTFGKITFVYNSTKPTAKVLDSLPFNTSVNILKEYPEFFLVCTPKAKSGYIKKTGLYFHSVFWGLKSCTYLFGISKYPKKSNEPDDFPSCDVSKIKVVKINKSNQIVDVYRDSILGRHYELKLLYNSALKNSEAVFYLNYDCYDEQGITEDHFIVDNGKKLSSLISARGSGDGGYAQENIVYLPVNLINSKKIVLAKNGVISVDNTTAKVELYPYPANCGIPIDELIIVEDRSVEPVDDDATGESKYDKDGNMAENITINETTYYQWNGTTLRKVKSIKGK